jgi:hypothetical protein
MVQIIYCDICGRPVGSEYYTITVRDWKDRTVDANFNPGQREMHICLAMDGMDVGCAGFFKQGIEHAKEQSRRWREEHRT